MFVACCRVSTDKQGRSGQGPNAQRSAVEQHAKAVGGEVVAEFRDVGSGRKADRSGLTAALAKRRARRAALLIVKLDRLARSVTFISNRRLNRQAYSAMANPTEPQQCFAT